MSYKREKAWIWKKINDGVKPEVLRDCVGVFSNKKKEDVMKKKNLSSKQYEKRYNFLENTYYLLNSNEYKKR